MKKIGRGWQYTVWDIGNNRVRKTFNTKRQVYGILIRDCFPYTSYPIWKFNKYHMDLKNKALHSLAWIKKSNINLEIFGNPVIINDINYEQDITIPLQKYFKSISFKEGKKIITKFIELNKFLINNGVIDKSFLIGKNYGVNKKGEVVLIDIGELFTEKEKIEAQIKLQPWNHPYVTRTIPKKFREFFVNEMDKNFI